MNKIFLRTGAWYSSETPALSDDLELSSLLNSPQLTYTKASDEVNEKLNELMENVSKLPPPAEKQCSCKNEIAALNKRIDELSKYSSGDFNTEQFRKMFDEAVTKNIVVPDDKPASIPAKKSVPKKPVAKKSAAKKK